MRRLAVVVSLLAFVVGCGGDSTGPSPTGTLTFALDPVTCAGRSGNIELFIDSATQGTYTFAAGFTRSFTVAAGSHVIGAREVGGTGITFGSATANVPTNGTFTATLLCP